MSFDWSLVVLTALFLAFIGALEGELLVWGVVVAERLFLYLRAIVSAAAFLLYQYMPSPSQNLLIGLGALAIFLGVLGYWPQVQRVASRLQGNWAQNRRYEIAAARALTQGPRKAR
jgi:hypothetical protein